MTILEGGGRGCTTSKIIKTSLVKIFHFYGYYECQVKYLHDVDI